jgi:hypothetical protein
VCIVRCLGDEQYDVAYIRYATSATHVAVGRRWSLRWTCPYMLRKKKHRTLRTQRYVLHLHRRFRRQSQRQRTGAACGQPSCAHESMGFDIIGVA